MPPKTAWKPGQSGNPKGRPKKGKTLTDILEKHGRKRDVRYADPVTGEIKNTSRKEALAKKVWQLALGGDITAIKYIYDRIDGRPDQAIDLEHFGEISIVTILEEAHRRRKERDESK